MESVLEYQSPEQLIGTLGWLAGLTEVPTEARPLDLVEHFNWSALPKHDWLIDWEPPRVQRTAISWASTSEDAAESRSVGMRGSLGRILYESLSAEGQSVVGLTRRAPPQWAEWRHEDYTDPASSVESLRDIDVVIHCAGGGLAGDKEAIFAANTHTTQHLVDTVNQLRHPLLFILVSSIAAGGPADLFRATKNHP